MSHSSGWPKRYRVNGGVKCRPTEVIHTVHTHTHTLRISHSLRRIGWNPGWRTRARAPMTWIAILRSIVRGRKWELAQIATERLLLLLLLLPGRKVWSRLQMPVSDARAPSHLNLPQKPTGSGGIPCGSLFLIATHFAWTMMAQDLFGFVYEILYILHTITKCSMHVLEFFVG